MDGGRPIDDQRGSGAPAGERYYRDLHPRQSVLCGKLRALVRQRFCGAVSQFLIELALERVEEIARADLPGALQVPPRKDALPEGARDIGPLQPAHGVEYTPTRKETRARRRPWRCRHAPAPGQSCRRPATQLAA